MKVLKTVVIFLLMVCPVFAEIGEQYDNETKSYSSESLIKTGVSPWDAVKFFNISRPKDGLCASIILFSSESGLWFFEKKDMEMLVDGISYKAEFIISRSSFDSKTHKENQMAIYTMNPSTRGKLKNAREVILKVYLKNRPDVEWKVPETVLDEWKKVMGAM